MTEKRTKTGTQRPTILGRRPYRLQITKASRNNMSPARYSDLSATDASMVHSILSASLVPVNLFPSTQPPQIPCLCLHHRSTFCDGALGMGGSGPKLVVKYGRCNTLRESLDAGKVVWHANVVFTWPCITSSFEGTAKSYMRSLQWFTSFPDLR